MIIAYLIGALLLGYCATVLYTGIRFYWCSFRRLTDTLPDELSEEIISTLQADALFQKGRIFHENNLFTQAIAFYNEALHKNSSHPTAKKFHQYALTKRPLTSPFENSPTSSVAELEAFSPLHSVLPEETDTLTPQTEPVSVEPEESTTEEGAIDISLDEAPQSPQVAPENLYKEAKVAFSQGQWNQAITLFGKVIDSGHNISAAYRGRARAFIKAGDPGKAQEDYSQLILQHPGNPDLYYLRGNLHLHKNELDAAVADYSTALRLAPNTPKCLNRRGTAYFRKKQYEQAAADFTRAIILNPDFAEAYTNRGIVRNQMGQKDQAQQDFLRAEGIRQKKQPASSAGDVSSTLPAELQALYQEAMNHLHGQDESKALVALNRVIAAAPQHPAAYFQRGTLHLQHRKLEYAIKDFTAAISCKPDMSEAYCKRGQANILNNLYLDAIADFDKAIALAPNNVDAYLNRGRANSQRGQREAAIEDFDHVLELAPSNQAALYNRGLEWKNTGALEKALEDLRQACELGNNAACIALMELQSPT